MSKTIKIKTSNGVLELKKSYRLIGVKEKKGKQSPKLKGQQAEEQLLGNFSIYKIARGYKKLEAGLEEIRKEDEVESGTHVYELNGTSVVPNGFIYVSLRGNTKPKDWKKLLKEHHLDLVEELEGAEILVKVSSKSKNPLKVSQALNESEWVDLASPDLDALPDSYELVSPSTPMFPMEWWLHGGKFLPASEPDGLIVPGTGPQIWEAWEELGNKGSTTVKVAVIDHNIDPHHPDYRDKIVSKRNIFNNNGNLDNIHPNKTHGTCCIGLIAGKETGSGICGVAPNSQIIAADGVTTGRHFFTKAFEFCEQSGADIISCSWGTVDPNRQPDPQMMDYIRRLTANGRGGKGSIIVFAAGNEVGEHINFFAKMPNVIAVAGSSSADGHYSYSNRGDGLTIAAPAGQWNLIAPRASWYRGPFSTPEAGKEFYKDGINRSDQHKHFDGTSASTPIVAGICALILSANPNLSAAQVKKIIMDTADRIGAPNDYNTKGYSKRFGYGRINALKAVKEAKRLLNPGPPPITAPSDLLLFDVANQAKQGWGIQMGIFGELGNVIKNAAALKALFNRNVVVKITTSNGNPVIKVLLGVFDSKAEATQMLSRVHAMSPNAFVVDLSNV